MPSRRRCSGCDRSRRCIRLIDADMHRGFRAVPFIIRRLHFNRSIRTIRYRNRFRNLLSLLSNTLVSSTNTSILVMSFKLPASATIFTVFVFTCDPSDGSLSSRRSDPFPVHVFRRMKFWLALTAYPCINPFLPSIFPVTRDRIILNKYHILFGVIL